MNRLTALFALAALSSCKFVNDWAGASEPAAAGGGADAGPVADGTLPTVGGSDPLDIVVTVLTLMGLPAAARLLALGKPLIAPLLKLFWPKKEEPTTQPPSTPS